MGDEPVYPGTAGGKWVATVPPVVDPDWLRAGRTLRDPEGERWTISRVGAMEVELGHPERGAHRLRRSDLVAWVEDGDWSPT